MNYSPIPSSASKSLGVPERRRWYCDWRHLFALFSCLILFVISILAVQPTIGNRWSISWRLEVTGQLILIGLLLALMSECTSYLASTLFLVIETRRKKPTLQNYEAIIKKSIFLDGMQWPWRFSIAFLTLLPLALSVAYKQLLGGSSTIKIESQFPRHYGLVPLPMGTFNVLNNSIYYMINASVPYMTASIKTRSTPQFPQVHGFNMILLNNATTVLLDLPSPDFLSSIQQEQKDGGSVTISADVEGTVARYNASTSSYRNDDAFWTSAFNHSYNPTGLSTIALYNGFEIGMINGLHSEYPGPYCLLGFLREKTYGLGYYNSPNDPAAREFRENAYKFEVQREKCWGKWRVTRNTVELVNGSCTGERTKQDVFNNSTPYYADTLPLLAQWLLQYSLPEKSRSPWLIPSLTTSVASMFWARMIYMNPTDRWYPEMYYPPSNETIWSTRATLKAGWALYLTLSVHPAISTVMLFLICLWYKTPIGKDFGLISVLSGIDRADLDELHGATLSGTLMEEIHMGTVVENNPPRIRYTLGKNFRSGGQLNIKRKYL